MQVALAYRGRSGIVQTNVGLAVGGAPHPPRHRVSFVGTLRQPLRFREAMSALHDVVISDLRFKPKDKAGYEQWKKEEAERERRIRTEAVKLKRADLEREKGKPMPKGLEARFERCRKKYWEARNKY